MAGTLQRRAMDAARARLADQSPDALGDRHPHRPEAGQRARPRPGSQLVARPARRRAARAAHAVAGAGAHSRDRHALARGAGAVASPPSPGRPPRRGLGPARPGGGARDHRSRGTLLLRPRPGLGRRPDEGPRRAAPRPRRPRPPTGRPHRHRARTARAGAGAQARARGRRRVPRRRHGLPLRRLLGTPRLRCRLVGRRGARLRPGHLAHAGPPGPDLPRRRRVEAVRHPAGRTGRVVPAQRRRDRAHRADACVGGRHAAAAPDRAHRARLRRAARHPPPPDPRARARARGRGPRRHRAGGAAGRVPGAVARAVVRHQVGRRPAVRARRPWSPPSGWATG